MVFRRDIYDGCYLEFSEGRFDGYCIYLTVPGVKRHAPLDTTYFMGLNDLGERYTKRKVYDDFVSFYELTDKKINNDIFEKIRLLSKSYGSDSRAMERMFSTVYMGMIAEENKENTRLGKKIKRLGLHQVLIENMCPIEAANFSKGKGWRTIEAVCISKGF